MSDNPFATVSSLVEILQNSGTKDFPQAHEKKAYADRYNELNRIFSEYPVEMGAMKNEIEQWKMGLYQDIEAAARIEDETKRIDKISEILDEDKIIFLNKHGADHIVKVCEKAHEILRCFNGYYPNSYELFLLLCSISVHDVGNLFGRANHEKRISGMLDFACANVIDDSIERRTIARIAGVHGGTIKGSKDTIGLLKGTDTINNFEVHEQMLAAVLRFADELADDNTRAVDSAMKAGILGSASEIYHVYSSKLHTVKLRQNQVTKVWEVVLRYEIDEDTAKKLFQKGKETRYLLDEIYTRTMKMEQERRYCMRFLRPYCMIESINIEITIDYNESVFDRESIKYRLEERGYPDHPYSSIKEVDSELITGEELALKLTGLS